MKVHDKIKMKSALTFGNHEAAEVDEVRNESDFPQHFETCNNTTKLNTAERGNKLQCFVASNTRYPSNHTFNQSTARAAKYSVYACSSGITLFLPKVKGREVALSSIISIPWVGFIPDAKSEICHTDGFKPQSLETPTSRTPLFLKRQEDLITWSERNA